MKSKKPVYSVGDIVMVKTFGMELECEIAVVDENLYFPYLVRPVDTNYGSFWTKMCVYLPTDGIYAVKDSDGV